MNAQQEALITRSLIIIRDEMKEQEARRIRVMKHLKELKKQGKSQWDYKDEQDGNIISNKDRGWE